MKKIVLYVFVVSLLSSCSSSVYMYPIKLGTNKELSYVSGVPCVESVKQNSTVDVGVVKDGMNFTLKVICKNNSKSAINFIPSSINIVAQDENGTSFNLKTYSAEEYLQKEQSKKKAGAVADAVLTGLSQLDKDKSSYQKQNETESYQRREKERKEYIDKLSLSLLKNSTIPPNQVVNGEVKATCEDANASQIKKITVYVLVGDFVHEFPFALNRDTQIEQQTRPYNDISTMYYNNGIKKYNRKDYSNAIEDFSNVIANKQNLDAYYYRGLSYVHLQQYEKAESDFRKIMATDQVNILGYLGMSTLKFAQKDYENAAVFASNAITLNPNSITAYQKRIEARHWQRRYAEAIEDYNQLIKLDTANADLYFERANLKRQIRDNEGAMADYDKSISINPTPKYWNYRGTLAEKISGMNRAKNDYERILVNGKKDSTYVPLAKYRFGQWHAQENQDELVQNHPTAENYFCTACFYGLLNEAKKTISFLDEAMKLGYNDIFSILESEDLDNIKYTNEFNEFLKRHNIAYKFTPQQFMQSYVEQQMMLWQQKGKYEKTETYLARIKEDNRKVQIDKFKEESIIKFKERFLQSIKWENAKVDGYDADKETFKISQERVGSFVLSVPNTEAESFEKNLTKLSLSKADFMLKDEAIVLSYLEITNPELNKTYVFDIQKQAGYNPAEFVLNFDPVNINVQVQQLNNVSNNSEQTKSNPIVIGKADVDMNIPTTPTKRANVFAIIIGNEDYSKGGANSEVNVAFAKNDAAIFRQYATKTLGLEDKNIFDAYNAGFVAMNDLIDNTVKLISKVDGDKELIFYYAGHGFPDEKTKIPYLIPVDVNATNLNYALKLTDVYQKLASCNAKKITVFLDACFSGGGREAGLLAARAVKIKPQEDALKGNFVVFAAASGEQSALPYKEKGHGMFTYYLLKKLQDTKGDVSYKELADYITKNVSVESFRINKKEQDPKVNVSYEVQSIWETWKIK